MKKKLLNINPSFYFFLFSTFFLQFSISTYAQDYEWKWAMNGGGSLGGLGNNFKDEQIYDVKVGTDNNYYFIATLVGPLNANLDGYTVPVYNTSNTVSGGTNDVFLFSTTCDGQVRWTKTIGGWSEDQAYNLVLDGQNNVYVGVNVRNENPGSGGGLRRPLHFSENDSIPFPDFSNGGVNIPQEGFKTTYLVKYDSDGNYIERKALQGNVTGNNFTSQISDLAIDSDGKIHFIIGLINGTHLEGNVTVPSSFNTLYNYQYYLAVYNSDLTYNRSMLLDLTGNFFNPVVRFMHDENKNQYYIAGMTSLGITGVTYPFSFDGNPIVNRSFILAFDDSNGSENWRREIYTDAGNGPLGGNNITSLAVDENSNVYIGGKLLRYYNSTVNIYDPTGSYTYPIPFTPDVWTNLPFVTKFDSEGAVQWVKTPTAFALNHQDSSAQQHKGLAINGNEIVFGLSEAAFEWDELYLNLPFPYRGDPSLLRLDKNNGAVLGLSTIQGDPNEYEYITAIAADNDGNYITGGAFISNLFLNNNSSISPLISTGEADFFVAKLANSECGSGNMGTNTPNKISINLFPNPTTGIVNVETSETLVGYTIYDMSGRQIQKGLFVGNNQIDLQNESKGVYFIKITTLQGTSSTVKIIKK